MKSDSTLIEIIHPICCGLDVHKDKVSACLITVGDNGASQHEIREYSTFTEELVKKAGSDPSNLLFLQEKPHEKCLKTVLGCTFGGQKDGFKKLPESNV